jgi:hypothetical protein
MRTTLDIEDNVLRVRVLIKIGAVAVLLIITGCDPDGSRAQFKSDVERTKAQYSASDVIKATKPIFQKFPTSVGDQTEDFPNDEIPSLVATLPVFRGVARSDIRAIAEGTNEVRFMVGGGFGHWGLIVFSHSAPRTPPETAGSEIVVWTNGVYFFKER